MKITLNKNQSGLTLGILFGAGHLLWAIGVGAGVAQGLVNYWHNVHFLTDMHTLGGFSLATLAIGTIGAFISGCIIGWIFGALWNWVGKKV
ncbi:MAG TPA: hypothetical protein VJI46_04030 [Candidatus Nanoarchaeia archaeon]|nr:hypothetical protein [Candidatus Nanoarchaeia archaeon]